MIEVNLNDFCMYVVTQIFPIILYLVELIWIKNLKCYACIIPCVPCYNPAVFLSVGFGSHENPTFNYSLKYEFGQSK